MAKKDMPAFEDQDRPKKVKEIYRALKRRYGEDMSPEMKARIAYSKWKEEKGQEKEAVSVGDFKKLLSRLAEDDEEKNDLTASALNDFAEQLPIIRRVYDKIMRMIAEKTRSRQTLG